MGETEAQTSLNKLDLFFTLVWRWALSNIYCSCKNFIMQTRKRLWNPTIFWKFLLEIKTLIVNEITYNFITDFWWRSYHSQRPPVRCVDLSFMGALKFDLNVFCHKTLLYVEIIYPIRMKMKDSDLNYWVKIWWLNKNTWPEKEGTIKLPELIFTRQQW
jgi:hypothetical protein